MSKIVKGIGKVFKKVFKKIKKVFKKIIKSPLGKILMLGAAIYTGGVAFGAWGSTGPLSGMYGVLGGAPTAAAAQGAITTAAPALAPEIATSALGSALGSAAPAVSAIAPAAAMSAAAPVVELGTGMAMSGAGVQAPGFLASAGNLIGEAATGIASFAKANPMITQMALQGVSAALTPDQIDIMNEQEKIRRSRYDSLSDVGNVSLGMSGATTPLTSTSGVPWHERLRQAGGR